ncbi:MAG: circadian phase modifier CpmA, partial [Parasutterella sp.]|nr:circadian phase modifier CpmA [Parasutterella sp.]
MTENRVLFDYDRAARTSVPEAVFCQSKSREVIYSLMEEFSQADAPAILFTRLSEEVFSSCPAEVSRHYSFDSLARIAFCKKLDQEHQGSVAVVSAGTADGFVTWEAARTLEFMNIPFQVFEDCGVAGLWRLESKIEE